MNVANYKVSTHVFEGPLDLLLSLIEKRKLFINEISLAQIADDYIAHIKNASSYPLSESAHFILIASTLVLIKSKSLLPTLSLTEEEEGSIEDLEARLVIYKRMKELSVNVRERLGKSPLYFRGDVERVPVFVPDKETHVARLARAIRDVLASIPKIEKIPHVVIEKVISLEHMIEDLTRRVASNLRMSFKEFAHVGKEKKVNVIVSFLAMLELVKQGIIDVKQDKHFEDIHMETPTIATPRYDIESI